MYVGQFDVYTGCGPSGSLLYAVAATAPGSDFVVIVAVNVLTEADLEALDRVLNSFVVL